MLQRLLGRSLDEFLALPAERRAELACARVPDLHALLPPPGEDDPRGRRAARLAERLARALAGNGEPRAELRARIVTDALLCEESAHDQDARRARCFTRTLTRAVPDLIFQPASAEELAAALHWARKEKLPLTTRGAATTAMGGAVPAAGGLLLDTARLDGLAVDPARRRARFGAGLRLRPLHARLAAHGLALPVYPANPGGTYAGWLVTGGIGLNAYGRGRALDAVVAAEVVLPGGEHVRLDRDGGLQLIHDGAAQAAPRAREDWFRSKGYLPLALADLAGSEGQLGVIAALEVELEPRRALPVFLLAFERVEQAHAALAWITAAVAGGLPAPADLKLLSAARARRTGTARAEEARQTWRALPGARLDEDGLPWTRCLSPSEVGARPAPGPERAAACVLVDFHGVEAGLAFAARLGECPGAPGLDDARSLACARERFRPRRAEPPGPGLPWVELLLPARRVQDFLPAAERLAAGAGLELDLEVSYLADGQALLVAGPLARRGRGSLLRARVLAAALLDLAVRRCEGRPYVIGRWLAPLLEVKLGADEVRRLRALKRALDPQSSVNRGAFFDMGLRGPPGRAVARTVRPAGRLFRALLGLPTPARWWRERRGGRAGEQALAGAALGAADARTAADSAGACLNCGECNAVCPIFHEAGIRLPQLLTHAGARRQGGEQSSPTGTALLDMCLRCGNCEQVCQADIPHLRLYETLQAASEAAPAPGLSPAERRARQVLLLERLRSSERYARDFLGLPVLGPVEAEPAPPPGAPRFALLREGNEAGPALTCIHCAACVDVCPTGANREYEGADPRWITTEQERCNGCGACVEVCPANRANGGRTLRVLPAPDLAPPPAPGS